MGLLVEHLNKADIAAWLALAAEMQELFGADMANDPVFLDWVTRSVARRAVYCIRINGEVAGVMQYRNGRINWLAVGKHFRRRGVGRALVTHALASEEPVVRVITFGEGHPHPEASAARALYQTLGFSPAQESVETVPDGTPRIVLVWYHSPRNPS